MLVVISQITATIGWLLLVYSYYKDDIEKLLFIQIVSSIFYSVSYLALGGWSGLLVCLFELIKEIAYYKTDKDNYIFLLTLPIYIIIGYYSIDTWIAILPIIGSIIDGFTLTKNKTIATLGGVISNILWAIYDFSILAFACGMTDAILVCSNLSILLVGYSYFLRTNKLRTNKISFLSNNDLKQINKIDNEIYDSKFLWNSNYQKELYELNKDSLILIKDNDTTIGYINYIVINEEEYSRIINSKKIITNYNIDNIDSFKKNKKNYIIIDAIAIRKKYQNRNAIKLIKRTLNSLIKYEYRHKHSINSILFLAVNDFEKEFATNYIFKEIKIYKTEETLYAIDSKTINNEILTKKFKVLEKYKNFKVLKDELITPDIIKQINDLDKLFFKKEYLWDYEYQLNIYNKNKNSFVMVTDNNNNLIGYINYLCITKDTYFKMKMSNTTVDDFSLDEISKFKKNTDNYITINSVVIKTEYQDSYIIKLLTNNLLKKLRQLNRSGYPISGIDAIAISKDGRHFCENLGLIKYKKLDDNNTLYSIERKELRKLLK